MGVKDQNKVTMKQRLGNAIDFLRSDEAILVVLFLALAAQLPHTAVVFHRVATAYVAWTVSVWGWTANAGAVVDWMHAFVAAISIEFAVLLFVVRGKVLLSWVFAASSVAMNAIYYWNGSWTETNFYGSVLWSAIIPVAIAFYSHELAAEKNGKHHETLWQKMRRWIGQSQPEIKPVPASNAVAVPSATKPIPPVVPVESKRDQTATLDEFAAIVASTNSKVVEPVVLFSGKTQSVYELMGDGYNDEQIGEQLDISPVTVRGHRKRIKDRLAQAKGVTE